MAKVSFYDIASVLVKHNGLKKDKANDFVKAIFDIIQERLPIDQQVKIKGLGTFKIIAVEDRESINVNTGERILIEGHSKVTFTPDSTMKELINKPFSQFETVILRDDVTFVRQTSTAKDKKEKADIIGEDAELNMLLDTIAEPTDSVFDDYFPEEFISIEEITTDVEKIDNPAVEKEIPIKEENTPTVEENNIHTTVSEETVENIEEPPISEVIPDVEETSIPEHDVETSENHVEEAGKDIEIENINEEVTEEGKTEEEETDLGVIEYIEDYEESPSHMKSILLHILYIVVIAALSAYCGYRYGVSSQSTFIEVKDTTKNEAKYKAVKTSKKASPIDTIEKKSTKAVQQVIKAQPTNIDSTKTDYNKYAVTNARVRTGAYIIVGEDRVVTVKKGETLSQLSKRILGEGMECYIEVFNGISAKTELQEGQKIKIPKLQLKKKKTNTPQPNTPQP